MSDHGASVTSILWLRHGTPPEVVALLIVVDTQLQVSSSILEYLGHRGVEGGELAGPHATLDQLEVAVVSSTS